MSNLAYGKVKLKVGKLYIGKLETTPVDLSKLSNAIKNDVVKKTEYDELVKNIKAIQTTDTSNLVKKTDYNTKINETEKKLLIMIMVISILLNKNFTENFAARLAQANLASKKDIAAFVKKTDFDEKLKNLKSYFK